MTCLRSLSTLSSPKQAFAKDLIMNKEIVAINQDKDAVMASKVYTNGRNSWMTDVWIKPLSDGSFAVALINKDPERAQPIVLKLSGDTDGDFYSGAASSTAQVRDVGRRVELGNHTDVFNATVPPMDGMLLRMTF